MEPLEELSYSPRGDLILALKFVPPDAVSNKKTRRSRGALHVLVKEAKSLAAVRPHGTADPVCKGLVKTFVAVLISNIYFVIKY